MLLTARRIGSRQSPRWAAALDEVAQVGFVRREESNRSSWAARWHGQASSDALCRPAACPRSWMRHTALTRPPVRSGDSRSAGRSPLSQAMIFAGAMAVRHPTLLPDVMVDAEGGAHARDGRAHFGRRCPQYLQDHFCHSNVRRRRTDSAAVVRDGFQEVEWDWVAGVGVPLRRLRERSVAPDWRGSQRTGHEAIAATPLNGCGGSENARQRPPAEAHFRPRAT